jgi:hypothetical protein
VIPTLQASLGEHLQSSIAPKTSKTSSFGIETDKAA